MFFMTRSAWASRPSSSLPVSGLRPTWPATNTRLPVSMPGVYGPPGAAPPAGTTALRLTDTSRLGQDQRDPRRSRRQLPGDRRSCADEHPASVSRLRDRRIDREQRWPGARHQPRPSGRRFELVAQLLQSWRQRRRGAPQVVRVAQPAGRRGRSAKLLQVGRHVARRVCPDLVEALEHAAPWTARTAGVTVSRPAGPMDRIGVTRSPMPFDEGHLRARQEKGHVRTQARSERALLLRRKPMPHAAWASLMAEAQSLLPPPSPAATGMSLSSVTSSAGSGMSARARSASTARITRFCPAGTPSRPADGQRVGAVGATGRNAKPVGKADAQEDRPQLVVSVRPRADDAQASG